MILSSRVEARKLWKKSKPLVVDFLKERGLTLSEEKTKITHIDDGFDFLGYNIRKYKGVLLIKPSKKSLKKFMQKIRGIIDSNKGSKTGITYKALESCDNRLGKLL